MILTMQTGAMEIVIYVRVLVFLFLRKNALVQVNFFQKKLTHNMTTKCSLNYKFTKWKFLAQNMGTTCCVQKLFLKFQNNFCTKHVLPMFCKNKSFWQRFTCKPPLKFPKPPKPQPVPPLQPLNRQPKHPVNSQTRFLIKVSKV